jgi:hypothetical protein
MILPITYCGGNLFREIREFKTHGVQMSPTVSFSFFFFYFVLCQKALAATDLHLCALFVYVCLCV